MTKKIGVILLVVFLTAVSLGIYLFLGKKAPVSPQAPAIQKDYVNPIFGYNLKIPSGFTMKTSQVSSPSASRKTDASCLTTGTSSACLISIDSYENDQESSIEMIVKNQPTGPKFPNKTTLGQYTAATWQNEWGINYALVKGKIIIHINFKPENSQTAKNILETIKL